MSITNGYATLAEFKAYRSVRGGTTATDAADDAVIEDIVELCSRYIDRHTGRRFWTTSATSDDETRYYTPESEAVLFTDDIAGITTLKTDKAAQRLYDTTLATTDYDLEPYNAAYNGMPYTFLTLNPGTTEYFPVGRKSIQIVGKFGFPSVPDDIKEACLAIALNIYQSRSGQNSAGNITVTAAGVVIRPSDVPDWAKILLDKYRRLV